MKQIDLYSEAKPRYYQLIPNKEDGLIILALYQKYEKQEFTEEQIIEVINKVLSDLGNSGQREEHNRNNNIILRLQEFFLWRDRKRKVYGFKNYGEDGFTTVKVGDLEYSYKFQDSYPKGANGIGVNFKLYVSHGKADDLDFVQTVYRDDVNGGDKLDMADVDPRPPYYLSAINKISAKGIAKNKGYEMYFGDVPGAYQYSSGSPFDKGYTWNAELTIMGKINGKNQALITFSWGYFYGNRRAISYGPFALPPSEFHNSKLPKK